MMKSEFDAEFNGYVDDEEYAEIEQAYYGYVGDKHEFIKTLNKLLCDSQLTEMFLQTCFHNDSHDYMTRKYLLQHYEDNFNATGKMLYGFHYAARLATSELSRETGLMWDIEYC